jgi:hypothetical protein
MVVNFKACEISQNIFKLIRASMLIKISCLTLLHNSFYKGEDGELLALVFKVFF